MTTPERWKEIDRIFAAALELEPEARAAFLSQACGGDEELRKEVESLLAHDLPESLVGEQAVEEATQLLVNPRGENPSIEYIGPYQVIRSLGAGGMGQVYLAQDLRLNRPVAVKLLSGYGVAEEERIRRFRREALAASALNHPNILTIYEIGETDGHNFIATEFVDGQALLDLIKSGPVSVATTTDIAIQIASALAAAHAAGIVHRDIKPANLMIRPDGLLKVLDFGIAKYSQPDNTTQAKESTVETAIGTVIGTAAYMSPEQARAHPIDARTDIWSLGIILYEMITSQRPFLGKTTLDIMASVIANQPLPFSTHGLVVPESFERIVFKTLQKDRETRYQTANELLADLKELKKTLESDAEDRGEAATAKHPQSGLRKETGVSIAVLPFVNMSADPENEYFCDGLSEELLNALTKIEDLKVAARTSAFSFKGKDATVSGIGRALNVTSVLEGSVRKSGNRLRITVQLINAANGYQVWSERYDRELQDIFDIQDQIALAVVDALKVTLLAPEKAAVLKRHTDNVEAYQLYLKGRYYWWKSTPEDFHRSRDFFQRAVDTDPTYALGYCGLSSYYGFGSAWGMLRPDEGWPLSIAANAKAMELDDTLAEAHNDLAGISMVCKRDVVATEREARRAIELNPGFQEIHYLYSFYLLTRGRFDGAIAEGKRAMELDPLSLRVIQHLGNSYYFARRYDEAVNQYRQALELDANNPLLYEFLGDAFEQKKMHREAVAAWQKAKELFGDNEGAILLGNTFGKDGFAEAVRAVAHKRLEELQGKLEQGEYVPAIQFARVYTRLGDIEQAFVWLEKACEERNVFPLLLHADPSFDSLRPDPRFAALLRRFGLTGDESKLLNSADQIRSATPAPVSTASAKSERKGTKNHEGQTRQNNSKTNRYLLSVGVLVLLLVVVGLAYWSYGNRHPPIESIAVMPFVNESGNPEIEYLSDGMTDSLINSLSQMPRLSVKARSSVFRYKGKEVDPQRIASELSVQAILNGRLVQRGDDLTLYLSLVDARNGNQLWGERYDRKGTDLVTLQSEIAHDVSEKLRLRLTSTEQQRLGKHDTENTDAYRAYLKGQYYWYKYPAPGYEKSLDYFRQAIELDPTYALGHVGLSYYYGFAAANGILPPNENWPKSEVAAKTALTLDNTLAEPHNALSAVQLYYYRDWPAAEREFRRAIELNPNSAEIHHHYAVNLVLFGRKEETLSELKRASDLDPLALRNNFDRAKIFFLIRQYDRAIDQFSKTLEMEDFAAAHEWLGYAYEKKGMQKEAVAEWEKALTRSGANEQASSLERIYARSGFEAVVRALAQRQLDQLKEKTKRGEYVPAGEYVSAYTRFGDKEQALVWFEKAVQERNWFVFEFRVNPLYDKLRDDPRFGERMELGGLAP